MAVRAKMVCNRIENGDLTMYPVCDGSPENEAFFDATPCGELTLGGMSDDKGFVVGKEYYIDITEAPE